MIKIKWGLFLNRNLNMGVVMIGKPYLYYYFELFRNDLTDLIPSILLACAIDLVTSSDLPTVPQSTTSTVLICF